MRQTSNGTSEVQQIAIQLGRSLPPINDLVINLSMRENDCRTTMGGLWQTQVTHFDIKMRLIYLAAGIAVFIISYAVAASVPLSDEEAKQIAEDFTERVQGIQGEGIFSNNAVAALGMFIPAAGAGIGIYAAYSTGIVFNAFAHITPALSGISPLSVFVTPFGILELFAYGLGISRSGILVRDLIKRRPWREYLLVTLIEIAIAVSALVVGAMIEASFIRQQ